MIEKLNRYTVGGRYILGDLTKDEPSHIHLPRRRRLARPDDRSAGQLGRASDGGEDGRGSAQLSSD